MQVAGDLLDAIQGDVETRRDHSTLVDPTDKVHHNLSSTMVIYNFQVANVAMFLHHLQKLDDNLGVGPDEHLTFATLLGIHDVVQAITQHTDTHHPFRSKLGEEGTSQLPHLRTVTQNGL